MQAHAIVGSGLPKLRNIRVCNRKASMNVVWARYGNPYSSAVCLTMGAMDRKCTWQILGNRWCSIWWLSPPTNQVNTLDPTPKFAVVVSW